MSAGRVSWDFPWSVRFPPYAGYCGVAVLTGETGDVLDFSLVDYPGAHRPFDQVRDDLPARRLDLLRPS